MWQALEHRGIRSSKVNTTSEAQRAYETAIAGMAPADRGSMFMEMIGVTDDLTGDDSGMQRGPHAGLSGPRINRASRTEAVAGKGRTGIGALVNLLSQVTG